MKNKTILVCDDNEGILDLVTMVLENEGYRAIAEQNSLNIFKVIDEEQPDLILLDLWMPVLSGDQILRTLRENPETSGVPVIIISASRDGHSFAKDSGANDYLPKPFDISDLVERIEGCLKVA